MLCESCFSSLVLVEYIALGAGAYCIPCVYGERVVE